MDRPDLPIEGVPDASGEPAEAAVRPDDIDGIGESDGMGWLGEIVAQLEADPEQCWEALESLAAIDRRRSRPDHRVARARIANVRASGLCSGCWARLPIRRPRRRPGSHSPRMRHSHRGGASTATDQHPDGADPSQAYRGHCPPSRFCGRRLISRPTRAISSAASALHAPHGTEGEGRRTMSDLDAGRCSSADRCLLCDVRLRMLDVMNEVEPERPSIWWPGFSE